MNPKAAVFACHVTGVIGLIAALFLWKIAGTSAFIAGLLGSSFWFGLGWYFRTSLSRHAKK